MAPQLVHQFGRARLTDLGDPIQNLSAIEGRFSAPSGKCFTRCLHGIAQVFSRSAAGVGEQLSPFAFDGVEAAGFRSRKFAVDVELVRLADVQPHDSTTYGASPCNPPSRPNPDSL